MNKIIWITGIRGSGKTSLANRVRRICKDVIVLDGEQMSKCFTRLHEGDVTIGGGDWKSGYKGSEVFHRRVAELALVLSSQQNVIVATAAPTQKIRDEVESITGCFWVYVRKERQKRPDPPYEPPETYQLSFDHKQPSIELRAEVVADTFGLERKWLTA